MGNMNDPVKAPFIKVYNFDKRLIASTKSVGNEGPGIHIVSMEYTYDDDNDDACNIVLQANDAKWLDYLQITREDILTVSWGYLTGPSTSNRTVVIRDIRSRYSQNGITCELKCSDMATYLKVTNSPFTENITPIDYIKQYCSGILNIEIINAGNKVYSQGAYEKEGETSDKFDIITYSSPSSNVSPNKPSTYNGSPYMRSKTIYENSYELGKWFVGESDVLRKFMEKTRDLNVANKSPYTVIYEIMQLAPQGPWFISGRDNSIKIHNRNLGNNSYKVYSWAKNPYNLLEFIPETKYEAFSKNTISQIGGDPLTKSANFIDSYISVLEKARSSKDIITDSGISDNQKEKELTEWLSLYNNGYQKYKTLRRGFKVTAGGLQLPVNNFNDPYYEDKTIAKRDVTNVVNPITKGKMNPESYVDPLNAILFGYQYVTPISDLSEGNNIIENTARKLEMEKEEVKATFEGDPVLKNDINITINNVHSAHSGDYYIKKCTHKINYNGYVVEIEGFKVLDEAVISIYSDNKTYDSEVKNIKGKEVKQLKMGAEERYKKESQIFRKWQITPIIRKSIMNMGSLTAGTWKFSEDNVPLTLEEYIEKNPDTNASDLIKLYKEGKLEFNESNTEDR